MYADKITDSMRKTIDETNRRRIIQQKYNDENGIVPEQIIRAQTSAFSDENRKKQIEYIESKKASVAADPIVKYMNDEALKKAIAKTKATMEKAAGSLDFVEAARLRDEMFELEKMLNKKE